MIDYTRRNNLAILQIVAPPANAITFSLLEELSAAFAAPSATPACEAL